MPLTKLVPLIHKTNLKNKSRQMVVLVREKNPEKSLTYEGTGIL